MCVCVCVSVCEREREREKVRGLGALRPLGTARLGRRRWPVGRRRGRRGWAVGERQAGWTWQGGGAGGLDMAREEDRRAGHGEGGRQGSGRGGETRQSAAFLGESVWGVLRGVGAELETP